MLSFKWMMDVDGCFMNCRTAKEKQPTDSSVCVVCFFFTKLCSFIALVGTLYRVTFLFFSILCCVICNDFNF